MYEKVNPSHPDKIADRIAGALVDLAYGESENPKIAVEVLIGHGKCFIITETSVFLDFGKVRDIVERISGDSTIQTEFIQNSQDRNLAENQRDKVRCGDNGIFKGVPVTEEQRHLSEVARCIYKTYPYDGKYVSDTKHNVLTICQSSPSNIDILTRLGDVFPRAIINPLGSWTGGLEVDTGATNRKLGSDMGDGVTGGGLHGKDLSKADVSVNIYAHIKAQQTGVVQELHCSIGDESVDGKPYEEIVEVARRYIKNVGGFEKFAEWGLI